MKTLCVLVLALGLAVAMPSNTCHKKLLAHGFSSNFNETIAHAIHSMTVEGLKLFNRKANEKNTVPTVNMDRHAEVNVVPYAPEDCVGSDFTSFTMNTFDKILTNYGQDNDGLGAFWSPLERVAHKFHMWDVWVTIQTVFESKVLPNPPKDDVCDCILDTESNGIYKAVKWVSDHYDSGTPITLLNRPIPKLADAASWAVWKERLLWYYTEGNLLDAANYLYCATKDF